MSDRAAALALSFFMAEYGWPLRLPTGKMTPGQLWNCPDRLLAGLLKLPAGELHRLPAFRKSFSTARTLEQLNKHDVTFIALGEPGYPRLLAQIHDPPPGLFIKGPPGRFEELVEYPGVAIVGARRASRYGIDAATMLAAGLSHGGVCIISGMAAGIDSAAHRGALEQTGATIAVLGCGPDVVYPAANRRLYASLLKSGIAVSEYPPGVRPMPWRFPARNRIISGLSLGVVVVEAKEKGGALITADFALEQGREVFAVPGGIFSDLSAGPNRLIRAGAAAVTATADILEELGIETAQASEVPNDKPPPYLDKNEQLVFCASGSQALHNDEIAARTGLDGAATATALVSLEIKGYLKFEEGAGFRRCASH